MNLEILASYVPDLSQRATSRAADAIVAQLQEQISLFVRSTAEAQTALNAIYFDNNAYRTVLTTEAGAEGSAIIERHKALQINYATRHLAFRYHSHKLLRLTDRLQHLLPDMIKEGRNETVDETFNRARRNNVILCWRLQQAMPRIIQHHEWLITPSDHTLITSSTCHLISLHDCLDSTSCDAPFRAPLTPVFLADVHDDHILNHLTKRYLAQDRALETYRRKLAVARIATTEAKGNPNGASKNDLVGDWQAGEIASTARAIAGKALARATTELETALEIACNADKHQRYSHLAAPCTLIVRNNFVAVKCATVAARDLLEKLDNEPPEVVEEDSISQVANDQLDAFFQELVD